MKKVKNLRWLFILTSMCIWTATAATAKCYEDIELLSVIETPEYIACSDMGAIQLIYLTSSAVFLINDKFDESTTDYVGSRLAFYMLDSEIEMINTLPEHIPDFQTAFDFFQMSLLLSTNYGNLEGERGTLYMIAFLGLVNKYGEGGSIGAPSFIDEIFGAVELSFDYIGDDLLLFSLCFWEHDIPTIAAELVFESEMVEICMNENKYLR